MKDINEEEWRDILGWEGFYIVSNLGRIFSIGRKVTQGSRQMTIKSKMLKQILNKKTLGYTDTVVYLASKDKGYRSKKYKIHRLVAEAFIPTKDKTLEVNHKDNNPLNNQVYNLEWVSHKENMVYSSSQNRMKGRTKK